MLLKINQLKVQYGKTVALDMNTPIQINEKDRIGIIGSNGAGKSTLIKSLLGIVNYEGSVESTIEPNEMAVHLQFNEYTSSMPIKYVMEAILGTKINKNKKLLELISYFEFEKCLDKKFKTLSGGQQQRFTIILVMMQDAPLTFYDEVTSGLDFETRQKLVEKLVEWYKDKESGLCIVSHYYEELEQLTDKLLILDQGKVIDFGQKDALFEKYCGKAILLFDKNVENETIFAEYEKLHSPTHLLAIKCDSTEMELEVTQKLVQHNINFKRSNKDIEMIFINAKEQAKKEENQNENA